MIQSFDSDIACKYGVFEAILINYLQVWISKNAANKRHEHDGRYWTYNSKKALSKLFPYVSYSRIERAIRKLVDEGVIIVGNYNKSTYDRTNWYAFTDFGLTITSNCGNALRQNEVMESVNLRQPIPNNKPVIKDNTIYDSVMEKFNLICKSLPKCIKLTDKRKTHIKKRLAEYGEDELVMAFRKAEDSDFLSGRKGKWHATFDWLMKNDDNIAKVLEGQYDNSGCDNTHDKLKQAYEGIK